MLAAPLLLPEMQISILHSTQMGPATTIVPPPHVMLSPTWLAQVGCAAVVHPLQTVALFGTLSPHALALVLGYCRGHPRAVMLLVLVYQKSVVNLEVSMFQCTLTALDLKH